MQRLTINGFLIVKSRLSRREQERLRDEIADIVRAAPFFAPLTPWGKPMSVRMSAAGKYGWFTDRKGYRYVPRHPGTGAPWPAIPDSLLELWHEMAGTERGPDCCLINHYRSGSRMGLHQDRDEADFRYPVLSVSLGDPATFRMGGPARSDPTRSVLLESGDVVLFGGAARLAYHGIDRIRFGKSDLLQGGGRLNLTLRVVD